MQQKKLRESFTLAYKTRINYDENLPISAKIDEIKQCISNNQVVIIAGSTGCGKTTQLAKICLDLGLGTHGLIGHTQPRRIAVTSIAERLAKELLLTNISDAKAFSVISHQIRFKNTATKDTYVKVMTDGILLAEISHDKLLHKYDTIIIDEAHERSLNIDFLLGYLKKILPKRPDLKVIITSATIDTQSFSKYFNNAPILEIEGATYPIQILYKDYDKSDNEPSLHKNPMYNAVYIGIKDLQSYARGDVLIFLSGERDIKELSNFLYEQQNIDNTLIKAKILPLYSKLSIEQQQQIFHPKDDLRIILATNIAETSITVPRIKYVIDTGLARIKRYSFRQKIEQLNIEKISQASANQRAGRCGRTSNGICIRLYSIEDFNAREAFTAPEIQRISLSNVVLKMLALKLGDIKNFDFLQAPSSKSISDAYLTLFELGALDQHNKITTIGNVLSTMPLDVRVARILLAGNDYGVLREILIIASSMSIADVKEYNQPESIYKFAHAKFNHVTSSFIEKIKLWHACNDVIQHRQSWNQVKQWCKDNCISFMRLKEWREVHSQLVLLAQNQNWEKSATLDLDQLNYAAIHKAILCGLVINIGYYSAEHKYYLGTYGSKFLLHHSQNSKKTQWIIASEIIDTGTILAHNIAKIEQQWIIETHKNLLKTSHSSPFWSSNMGKAMVNQSATLYGLNIYSNKIVNYVNANLDLIKQSQEIEIAHELLLKHALIEEAEKHLKDYKFLEHNQKFIQNLEKLEQKIRLHNILISDEDVLNFYTNNIPKNIFSLNAFARWYKDGQIKNKELLFLTQENIANLTIQIPQTENYLNQYENLFPNSIRMGEFKYKLSYRFEPGHALDGISIHIPISHINQVNSNQMNWLVPGLIQEKVIALIKSLEQSKRKYLVPIKQYAQNFLERVTFGQGNLLAVLITDIEKQHNLKLSVDDFKLHTLAAHLSPNYKIVNNKGQYLAADKNLSKLQQQLQQQASTSFNAISLVPASSNTDNYITKWVDEINNLPRKIQQKNILAYLSLTGIDNKVQIKAFDTYETATIEYIQALIILYKQEFKLEVKKIHKDLLSNLEFGLNFNQAKRFNNFNNTFDDLCLDIFNCASGNLFLEPQTTNFKHIKNFSILKLPQNKQSFEQYKNASKFIQNCHEIISLCSIIFKQYISIYNKNNTLSQNAQLSYQIQDIKHQLNFLFPVDFLSRHSWLQIKQWPRYLQAIQIRQERLHNLQNLLADNKYMQDIHRLEDAFNKRYNQWQQQGLITHYPDKYQEFLDLEYIIQELRIGLFAQNIKTLYPISVQRFEKMLDKFIF